MATSFKFMSRGLIIRNPSIFSSSSIRLPSYWGSLFSTGSLLMFVSLSISLLGMILTPMSSYSSEQAEGGPGVSLIVFYLYSEDMCWAYFGWTFVFAGTFVKRIAIFICIIGSKKRLFQVKFIWNIGNAVLNPTPCTKIIHKCGHISLNSILYAEIIDLLLACSTSRQSSCNEHTIVVAFPPTPIKWYNQDVCIL